MRKIQRIFETYFSCVQENRQLETEVGNQRIKLEGCQDHQKKLTDENMELKRKLYKVEKNQNMLSKQLKEKTNDMQHMESLNQILVVRDCLNNCELLEARIELKNGLQDVLNHHSLIGITRMGVLNLKPFQDVCMQKFLSEDWDTKSAELCSLWQENIKNQQWFPFKRMRINRKLDVQEVVDDNDDKLKQLKDAWGEQVYKAVCGALSQINEYNPNTRCAVPEIWNFKHDRRARLKEVIEYLLKKLKVMINPRMLPQLTTGLKKASPLDSGGIRN